MTHEIKFEDVAPTLNGKHLDKLVEAFLKERLNANLQLTINGYRFKLRPFFDWWNEIGPERDWMLSADDLPAFVKYLAEKTDWGFHSRHDSVKRLKQVFKWAHKRGMIPIDFSLFIPNVRGGASERRAVTVQALQSMLDACWQLNNPIRNRAVIALFAGTGLRLVELTSLRIEDIELTSNGGGFATPRKTKNDKPRTVVFDAATGSYLKPWLELLSSAKKKKGPLWPSRTGGRSRALTTDGISKIVADAAKLAGVDVSPHDFRRMYATFFMRAHSGELNAKLLQKQLGHTHFSTTSVYLLPQVEDIYAAVNKGKTSPVSKLSPSPGLALSDKDFIIEE